MTGGQGAFMLLTMDYCLSTGVRAEQQFLCFVDQAASRRVIEHVYITCNPMNQAGA